MDSIPQSPRIQQPPAAPDPHASAYERMTYRAGTHVFWEGDPADCAYLIEHGHIEISMVSNGRRCVMATLGAGDLLGEMALVDDHPRSATAMARDDAELIAISRDQFQAKLRKADPVLGHVLKMLVERLRSTSRQMLEQSLPTSEALRQSGTETMQAIHQIRLAQDLQKAIDCGQFRLFYQPIVQLSRGFVAGFEALLRWEHPERGRIAPSGFIQIAEDTGLIGRLGPWMLEQASQDLARFQHLFEKTFPAFPELFMSINLSAGQLQDLAEVDRLRSVVSATGRPAQLKLEITEGLLIESPETASLALERFKETGVSLAIDDFGTGYSSLSYLHRFHLDTLKVDRSFVQNMSNSRDSLQIVRAIIELAKALDMDVVAEGVEAPEALIHLREFGCAYAQGYLISKPVPADDILAFLATRPRW